MANSSLIVFYCMLLHIISRQAPPPPSHIGSYSSLHKENSENNKGLELPVIYFHFKKTCKIHGYH